MDRATFLGRTTKSALREALSLFPLLYIKVESAIIHAFSPSQCVVVALKKLERTTTKKQQQPVESFCFQAKFATFSPMTVIRNQVGHYVVSIIQYPKQSG